MKASTSFRQLLTKASLRSSRIEGRGNQDFIAGRVDRMIFNVWHRLKNCVTPPGLF